MQTHDWTYGAEHEFGDWDTRYGLPLGFARSPDYTIVNSNGVAAQPNPRVYPLGGEINTPPTASPDGQVELLKQVLYFHPACVVNHRSNLHIHIRVPGLRNNLQLLKCIQKYVHQALPEIIDLIEPIPSGNTAAEKKRERRRRISHHTFLTEQRLQHQLKAATAQEFFKREVPKSWAGAVMWHAQPRLAVGLRQLLQTDTIEFRHFPGTIDAEKLLVCICWCRDFLKQAICNKPIEQLWNRYYNQRFPEFPPFDYQLEVGYQATASHNGLSQAEIKRNIQLILTGVFHGSTAEKEAAERACSLSRKHLSEPASQRGTGENTRSKAGAESGVKG